MKRKLLFFVLAIVALASLLAIQAFAACDPSCTTDFACKDADGKCNVCGEDVTVADHTWAGDCDLACDVCQEARTSLTAHTYTNCLDVSCNVCLAERDATGLAHTYDNACDLDCNTCGLKKTPDVFAEGNWKYGQESKLTMADEQLSISVSNSEGGVMGHWWTTTNIKYLIDENFYTAMVTAPNGEQVMYTIKLDETRYVTKIKVYFNTIDQVSLSNGTQSDANYNANLDIIVKCYDANGNEVSSETFASGGLTEKELTIGKGVSYVTVYPKSRWDLKAILREVEIYSAPATLDHKYTEADCDDTCNLCLAVTRDVTVDHVLDYACKDADGKCATCLETVTLADHTWEAGCDTECDVCGETRTATGTHGSDHPCYDADGKCNVCGVDITVTGAHAGDYACYDADNKCNACGQDITITASHEWTGVCDDVCDICNQTRVVTDEHTTDSACKDADGRCNVCGSAVPTAAHTPDYACKDADGKCNVCDEDITLVPHDWAGDCDVECGVCEETREVSVDHTIDFGCYDADNRCNICAEPIRITGTHITDKACKDADGKCNVCSQDVTLADHTWTGVCDTQCGVCKLTRTAEPHTTDKACKDADGKCNVCGNTVELANHTYGAACDTTCDVCLSERADAAAHTLDKACKDADGKCNACGATVEPANHTYSADCDTTCDVCGDTRTAEPHTTDKACKDADGKCNVCGENVVLGAHTWASDCDTECDACGDTREITVAHTFGDWTELKGATKDADGEKTHTCTVCGFVENAPIVYEGGLGAGAIVGIVAGSVVVVGVGGFSLFWFVIKKKSWADLVAVFKK
ncbi:MAG: hypothetical protein IJW10_01410 [Clostridia bacterium]|nr:hypothetical protein [Clostridia bacterium]